MKCPSCNSDDYIVLNPPVRICTFCEKSYTEDEIKSDKGVSDE